MQKALSKIPLSIRNEFIEKLAEISAKLGVRSEDLMVIFWLETAGTMSPAIVNQDTGTVGLIQFSPATLKWLKYTTSEVKNMNHVKQLDVVYKYLKCFKKVSNLLDLYLTVFFPLAVGKRGSHVIGRTAAEQKEVGKDNPVFNGGKPVTIDSIKAFLTIKANEIGYDVPFNNSNKFATVIACLLFVFILWL